MTELPVPYGERILMKCLSITARQEHDRQLDRQKDRRNSLCCYQKLALIT